MRIAHCARGAHSLPDVDPADYPDLFRELDWKVVTATFELGDLPSDDMIANVNVVPIVDGRWLLVRFESGVWWVPGGTREPGEPMLHTVRRELLEEAGSELIDVCFFGSWKCRSTQPEPYRPHVPHPVFYRAVGIANVRVVGPPTTPDDGEKIAEVAVVSLKEAMIRFRSTGRADLADLYRLAACLRVDETS